MMVSKRIPTFGIRSDGQSFVISDILILTLLPWKFEGDGLKRGIIGR